MISSDWRSQLFFKKIWRPEFGPDGPKSGPKLGFLPFSHGTLVFLEIACNDSLPQCLTSSRGKLHGKFFGGPNLGQRGQNRSRN